MKGLDSIGLRAGQTRHPLYDRGSRPSLLHTPRSRVAIRGNCVITKKPHSIIVYNDELDKWLAGDGLIQNVLVTDISADDREFLMTGISPEGWDIMFPKTGDEIDG